MCVSAYGSVSEMENHTGRDGEIKMPWLAAFLDGIAGKNGICKDFMHMILAQVSGSLVNRRCSSFSRAGIITRRKNFMNTIKQAHLKLVILGLMTGILLLMAYTPSISEYWTAGDYI